MPRPNFLVIGAYKSGTTSLDRYLRQHPEVFLPAVKEPNYFATIGAEESDRPTSPGTIADRDRYVRLFDGVRDERAIGEVSPEYLVHPAAAAAIATELPEVRLIAVLRNPVERAYSDFLMYLRDGREQLDFAGALAAQDERSQRGDPTGHYVDTGFYGAHLQRFYDRFDRDQLRVHLFEELASDPKALLCDLFGFLGVDPSFVPTDTGEHNVSGVPRNAAQKALLKARAQLGPSLRRVVPAGLKHKIDRRIQAGLDRPPLPDECRRALVDVYRADLEHLGELLGRDLGSWLSAAQPAGSEGVLDTD